MTYLIELVLILLTLYLTRQIDKRVQDTVVASILASSIIILPLSILNINEYAGIIFGASFIGMTSFEILKGRHYYYTAPAFLLFYEMLSLVITNVGGLLGFSALLSVLSLKLINCFKAKV